MAPKTQRYSVSLVTQRGHKFYTLTMPSTVLAHTCFVSRRDEDPQKGFQRFLDPARARDIANYIDTGFGTIPSSIVLSAQAEANLKIVGRGKTMEFVSSPRAFLILDGQHRVFGFSKAETELRVPVVVYNGLSRKDESRLFIDINTKQRPVPNELLLDIKKLAEYETDTEHLMSQVFDLFNSENDSPLIGLLSPIARRTGKISRVTFNTGLKPLLSVFADAEPPTVYAALRSYLCAFLDGAREIHAEESITNPTVFRSVLRLFVDVAQRVKDRHGADYNADNFQEVLRPLFARITRNTLLKPGASIKELSGQLSSALRTNFML